MLLHDLHVYHYQALTADAVDSARNVARNANAFMLETCQRTLVICDQPLSFATNIQCFRGNHAYAFLLQVLAGLHSRIQGETEIQSQFKTEWRSFRNERLSTLMNPWVQKLMGDVKAIRTEFLQGVGGTSYGTLVRHVCAQRDVSQILIIGAGQLAESIVPYFKHCNIRCWNRTKERADKFVEFARNRHQITLSLQTGTDWVQNLSDIKAVFVCTPAGAQWENDLLSALAQVNKRPFVVHLGAHAHALDQFRALTEVIGLDQLFDLQVEQNQLKERRVNLAMQACVDKAAHRNLTDAIAMTHGWEDLAAFV